MSKFMCSTVYLHAKWGGGLCMIQQQANSNIVSVLNSTFVSNTAGNGGGGLAIRLDLVNGNNVHFQSVTFDGNRAGYGGGMSINALFGNFVPEPGEILMFTNSTWHANSGYYSPAVDISPHAFRGPVKDMSPLHYLGTSTLMRIMNIIIILGGYLLLQDSPFIYLR